MVHLKKFKHEQLRKNMNPFQKYVNTGSSALDTFHETLNKLLSHPTSLEDEIMSNYRTSPYAQNQLNQITEHMNRKAAATGELGTPNEDMALARNLQQLIGADEQNYLKFAMAPYEQALSGLGSESTMGLNAAGQLERQNEFNQQMQFQKDQSNQGLWGGLVGSLLGFGADIFPYI